MPIATLSPDLQGNEALKSFEKEDDLAKSYLDLHAKYSSGSLDIIPEDLRKDPSMGNFKTVSDVAKGFIETKKLVGTIKRPPADPTGYKFSNVEGVHPSLKPDANFQKILAENAHRMGLAEDQADGVHKLAVGYVSQLVMDQEKKREETRQKNEASLKQDWGADYDKRFNNVTRMLLKAGGEDLMKELGPALKNAPLALKAFDKISSLLSEDSIESLGADGGKGGGEGDEKEYQAMRDAIAKNDTKHPLMDDRHPKHSEAVKRYQELSHAHFTREK